MFLHKIFEKNTFATMEGWSNMRRASTQQRSSEAWNPTYGRRRASQVEALSDELWHPDPDADHSESTERPLLDPGVYPFEFVNKINTELVRLDRGELDFAHAKPFPTGPLLAEVKCRYDGKRDGVKNITYYE